MKRTSRSLEPGEDRGHVALPLERRARAERSPTPSSSRTMKARLVLPSPGGPIRSRWSSASPRTRVASSAIASCSLIRSWPTNSSSRRGRSERSSSSSSGSTAGARNCGLGAHAGPQRLPHALLGRAGQDRSRRAPPRPRSTTAELDQRVARDGVRLRRRSASARPSCRASPSARARPAARSSCRSPGSPRSAPCPRARSRGAGRPGRAGHDRQRDLRPDAGDGEQMLEQLALGGLGEAVELERVLAHVQIGLERSPLPRPRPARSAVGVTASAVADAADVEHEPLGRARHRLPRRREITARGQARTDVPAPRSACGEERRRQRVADRHGERVGGVVGRRAPASSPRIAITIRCTWAFSARP